MNTQTHTHKRKRGTQSGLVIHMQTETVRKNSFKWNRGAEPLPDRRGEVRFWCELKGCGTRQNFQARRFRVQCEPGLTEQTVTAFLI